MKWLCYNGFEVMVLIKVLFVCLGNICRSPMAEGMMKKMVHDLNMTLEFLIESRATSTWEIGNPPHPGTVKILKQIGYPLPDKRAKQITVDDVKTFNYILAMDDQNIADLKRMFPSDKHKFQLVRSINPNANSRIIEDPYYSGKHEETFKLLNEDIPLWIDRMITDKKRD